MNPVVSVIIPVHNRARLVCAAVESVLAQTFTGYELIVVDDGSVDDTLRALTCYGKRIRLIRQANRGVSAARNAGIAAANGALIAFLDSDDLWLPHKLLAQTNFFTANPAAMWQQTEEIWLRHGQRVNPKKRHQKLAGRIFRESLELCLVSPSAVMLRRELLDEFGAFDESLPACEDYDLWLRILTKYPVYLDSAYGIIKHGGHAGQLSSHSGLDAYRIQSLQKILRHFTLVPEDKMALVQVLKSKCEIFALGCVKRGKLDEARYYDEIAQNAKTALALFTGTVI